MMYENLKPDHMNKAINLLGKKTTVYFIGFCVFFVMAFFYSTTLPVFFTVLTAMLFMGFLLVYYMVGYVFVRILRLFQVDNNFVKEFLNVETNIESVENTDKDREEIPEI